MFLLNEFVEYVIKFICLGGIAIAGVLCGVKYKKNKIAKENTAIEDSKAEETTI